MSNIKKVAIIEPIGAHGGNDTMNYWLLEMLNFSNKIEAILYTSSFNINKKHNFDIKLFFNGSYGRANKFLRLFRYLYAILKSLKNAKKNSCSIVHFHIYHFNFLELLNLIFAKIFNFKIIFTVHDVESLDKITHNFFLNFKSIFFILGDKIVFHSKFSKKIFLKNLYENNSLIQKKCFVIPLVDMVHERHDNCNRLEACKKLDLPINKEIILFFGQIKKSKGLDVILNAMSKLNKSNSNVLLVIAGKIWKDNNEFYNEIIQSKKLDSCVIQRLGYVKNEDVPYYMSCASMVILPYRKIYNSGVLSRAMSYKLPIVASNLEPFSEQIINGENGFLFENGDHISLANTISNNINNKSLLKEVGENGYNYLMKRCNIIKVSNQYNDLYC
jgi:D-inositol-3-phosphate glycosyltransferase